MVRDGKPKGFFYLDHRTVDGRLGIITDTYTTPANVHDSIVYLSRLDRQRERFQFHVAAVGLDAGYATAGIAKGLAERQIMGVTGDRKRVVGVKSESVRFDLSGHRLSKTTNISTTTIIVQ